MDIHTIHSKHFFEEFQRKTDEQILKIDKTAFVDGIINIEKYLNQTIKILWILKEPNSTEEGLNWREEIKKLNDFSGNLGAFDKTFRKIVYVSYGIINKKKWNEFNYIKDEPNIVEVLEQIAFINIKKIPGGSTSYDTELEENYQKYKDIIIKQIKMFKPNVIIGGNTIKFLQNDLKLIYPSIEYKEYVKCSNLGISISKNDNLIVFDAYHPQYNGKGLTDEVYYNDIVENYLQLSPLFFF